MVSSPDAQTPIVHQSLETVRSPFLSRASCICTWIQVPLGVAAFHDATSSSNSKPGRNQGPVQVPDSYAWPLKRPSGSVPATGAGPIARAPSAPTTRELPSIAPAAKSVAPAHWW